MPDSLIRDPMGSTPASVLNDCDTWLVCLRASDQYCPELFDNWDEAIDAYDHGFRGWHATALYGCRRGEPVCKLTYFDIQRMRA